MRSWSCSYRLVMSPAQPSEVYARLSLGLSVSPILRKERRLSRLSSQDRSHCRVFAAVEDKQSVTAPEEITLVEISGRSRREYSSGHASETRLPGLQEQQNRPQLDQDFLEFVKSFILPKGYPHTVSEEYLLYQLRTLPAHITGWMSTSLATSSLIHALGVGAPGPTGTVAASAAIKWITKDGLGAFGRFLVGGRLGGVFDEDPRRWRMIAVSFATVGLALEIATTAFPSSFIILAGAGNFTKAVGRGLSQPCFRIIQNHFAAANNVGDISAKEEVWEVTAQLLGLGSSVVLLRAIESGGKPEAVLWIWLLLQTVHVALRYYSLASLRFPELNQKRASILVSAHVAGEGVPDIRQANEAEPMLLGPSGVAPRVDVGVGVQAAFGTTPGKAQLVALDSLYKTERFWLVWRNGRGYSLLLDGFGARDMLRLLWQAAWLEAQGIGDAETEDYADSLAALDKHFPDFERHLEGQGWEVSRSVFRLGDVRIEPRAGQHSDR